MNASVAPISAAERIPTLDAVRGFALLGIFIMNMESFSASLFARYGGVERNTGGWDFAAETLRNVLFAGKFNSMFSMLFAVGFTIQLTRFLEREPQRANALYLRRIFWLFVFGALHACVFWVGDVLHIYALFGLVLLFLRRAPDRVLVAVIILSLLFPAATGLINALTTSPDELRLFTSQMKTLVASGESIYAHGTFLQVARQNVYMMGQIYSPALFPRFYLNVYVTFLTTMVLGLLLGRHRVFQNIVQYLPQVRRLQWWALGTGLISSATFAGWLMTTQNPLAPSAFKILASTAFGVSRVAIMSFYVCVIIRAMTSERWRSRLEPLVLAGRMPLTNYLLQTVIATFIFYGWGLGFYERTGAFAELLLALAIFFGIQVPLSRLWLRRFRMGPMEYLWRVLIYGRTALKDSGKR
jgi:uncharacterized protein